MEESPMDTITFKRYLVPYVVEEEAVYLVSERGVSAVHGELAAVLAPLLDGTRAAEEIVAELAERYPADRVRRAIDSLARAGRISYTGAGIDRQQAAYWELGGLDGDAAVHGVATGAVGVEVHGDVDLDEVGEALAVAGLRVAAPGETRALTVVVTDDYLQPSLAARNDAA